MKNEKMKSFVEVHVCNHKRDDDECCFERGSKNLTDKLKKWAKEETKKEVKVFRSGCLGKCSEGIVIACYPQKEMLLDVREKDFSEVRTVLESYLKEAKKV